MDTHGQPALKLSKLIKRFHNTLAVNALDLSIPKGIFYSLLGKNGAGKTTTLRMIAGLLKPDAGDIDIYGKNVWQEPEQAKQRLAFLPDEPLVYDLLRPFEYLEFVAGLWGRSGDSVARRAMELLEQLELTMHAGKFIHALSRGMRQKLALAGALIHDPDLIILDEPLTGLDVASARQVKDLLKNRVASGKTVLLTTHSLDIAEKLADCIGILDQGKLLAEGSLEELRQKSGKQGSLEDIFLQLTRTDATLLI